MNITNKEARAAAMTAYHAYEHDPDVAMAIMFDYENIRYKNWGHDYGHESPDWVKGFLCQKLNWSESETVDFDQFMDVAKKIPLIDETKVEDKEITDPYIQDYAALIERVAKIDVDAAAWMLFEAPKMKIPEDFEYSENLLKCFSWFDTLQGFEYWWRIHEKLRSSIIEESGE